MNGDQWGLYDVLPAENVAHFKRVAEEYQAHHKDTVFSPYGWKTPPYVIPPPPIPLSVRRIRVEELRPILGEVMPTAPGVDSCVDFTGRPYPCPDAFAFALSLDRYWQCEGFYGTQKDGFIKDLYVTQNLTVPDAELSKIVDAVVRLGSQFDLVLLANADHVVDLRDPGDVIAFIKGEDTSAAG